MIQRLFKQAGRNKLHWDKPQTPAVQELPIPPRLVFTLPQEMNERSLLVSQGSYVLKGQALTRSDCYLNPPLHATSSGYISAISKRHLFLEPDHTDAGIPLQPPSPVLTRADLIDVAHHAGLRGHGGAGYPVAAKLQSLSNHAELLLVNAAECDPAIHCDDGLMLDRTTKVIEAIVRISSCCTLRRTVIGIEDNKVNAIKALRTELKRRGDCAAIELITVPSQYPSGAERLLLQKCTGRTVDPELRPSEQGILSMNVATCYALGEIINTAMPCTDRITTVVTVDKQLYNYRVRLGTPLSHLLQATVNTRHSKAENISVSVGGYMMGEPVSLQESVTQSTNCLIVNSKDIPASASHPCIRCGACSDICPENLMPQNLYTHSVQFDPGELDNLKIHRCIECRSCDVVCPSDIALTSHFQHAKAQIESHKHAEANAALAKRRYEKRLQRLAEAGDKNCKKRTPRAIEPKAPEHSRKALIEAALKRSLEKKSGN